MNLAYNLRSIRDVYVGAIEEVVNPSIGIKLERWRQFSEIFGGFRPNEYTIVCGATGAGKTAWCSNVSSQLLVAKKRHFVLSVENGENDYFRRVISNIMGKDINRGERVPEHIFPKIEKVIDEHCADDNMFLSIHDNRIPVDQLIIELRYAAEALKCEIAFIDNLNFLLDVKRAQDSLVEMDRVTHELISFCKQTKLHIVMIMHPRKTDGGRVESEFDIKGSSTAVQEAHNILLLNRPRQVDLESGAYLKTDRELTFQKLRKRGFRQGERVWFSCEEGVYHEESFTPTGRPKLTGKHSFGAVRGAGYVPDR